LKCQIEYYYCKSCLQINFYFDIWFVTGLPLIINFYQIMPKWISKLSGNYMYLTFTIQLNILEGYRKHRCVLVSEVNRELNTTCRGFAFQLEIMRYCCALVSQAKIFLNSQINKITEEWKNNIPNIFIKCTRKFIQHYS